MKKIQTRLILSFFFITILLLIQGVVAYHNIQSISKSQISAYTHKLRIKDSEYRLANARLLVFKILGTMHPAQMDAFHEQFEKERTYLETSLISEGIGEAVIDDYFRTYADVIALHYDFRVRTAQKLLSQESKQKHEALVTQLQSLSEVVQKESEEKIQHTYWKTLQFTFGILTAALMISFLLAFILARTLMDRQQAENELRESEEKYRSILDNASAVIFIKDLDGSYLFVNKIFEKLFGMTNEKIQRLTDADIFPHDISAQFRENDLKVLQSGKPMNIEETVPQGDDTRIFISTKFPLLDLNQKAYAICGIATDITELKQAQKSLAVSEERLNLALDSVSDAVWDWRPDTGEVYFSSRWYTMLGYEPGELPQEFETWKKLLYPDDLPDSEKTIFRHLETAEPFETEFRMSTRDGQWRWILARGKTVEKDDQGKAIRMLGTHVDITERKAVEKELLRQKERAERYLNLAGVMFIGLDRNGNVNLANQQACRILECDETDILGLNWFDHFIPESERNEILSVFRQLVAGKTELVEYYKNPIVSRSGKEKYIAWHNTYITDENGGITGILSSGEDITEKRLLETRLRQAQKMESIGNLAGGIAHDFNNLLSPIIGMSELLLEDLPDGSPGHDKVREIFSAGMRGSNLVRQILAFSRQSEHQLMPTHFQRILKEVLSLSRSTIPANIGISHDIQKDCGQIMADPTQLHQIAMNLITNAYHAIDSASGGTITVSLREAVLQDNEGIATSSGPGRYAVFSVSDTGKGIDPGILDKIFEPYYTTKEKGKGTGLGLAVVYGIVRKYGGDINVRSEPDSGATFDVWLPLMIEMSSEQEAAADVEQTELTGDERILLVDDEEMVAELEKEILERLGYEVVLKTSSTDALETFQCDSAAFDLVITDMTMPGMTGDQLTRALLRIRPDIPIIICTGFSERITKEKAISTGVKGFLMKPFGKSEMAQTVRKVLDEAGISATAGTYRFSEN